jgi:hypothetical protein
MVVGVGAVIDIGWHVYHHLIVHHHSLSIAHHSVSVPSPPAAKVTVLVIASALAVAAGVELAYTLFTPGPDEALDPLMLGLSSGILLLVTGDTGKSLSVAAQFSGVLLGVLALGALFLIRRHLIGRDEE